MGEDVAYNRWLKVCLRLDLIALDQKKILDILEKGDDVTI